MSENVITTDLRLKQMQLMRRNGYSDAEVGLKFGLSRQRVHTLLGTSAVDRRRGARVPDSVPPTALGTTKEDRALPAALASWRTRYGLTQIEAAKILHLKSVVTYSKWERGLGCSLSALVLDFLKLWEHAYHTREIRT